MTQTRSMISNCSRTLVWRAQFRPEVPELLRSGVGCFYEADQAITIPEIHALFPHISHDAVLKIAPSTNAASQPSLRVGILLSGGPAPGGHTVIASLYDALMGMNDQSLLIGIKNGPQGLLNKESCVIAAEAVDRLRNSGGFDFLGTSRKKIATEEEIKKSHWWKRLRKPAKGV